jgi:hypothetical protein
MPAIISEATAFALFGAGMWAINRPPADSIPAIEEQKEPALPAPATVPTSLPRLTTVPF